MTYLTSDLSYFFPNVLIFFVYGVTTLSLCGGDWRLPVVQSECKTKLAYHVVEWILNDKKG